MSKSDDDRAGVCSDVLECTSCATPTSIPSSKLLCIQCVLCVCVCVWCVCCVCVVCVLCVVCVHHLHCLLILCTSDHTPLFTEHLQRGCGWSPHCDIIIVVIVTAITESVMEGK